jgi:hypothetical protein
MGESHSQPVSVQRLLDFQGESQCETALSELCVPGSGLLDGHLGAIVSPSQSQSLDFRNGIVIGTPLRGKVDLLSSSGPLFLEIKGRPFSGNLITKCETQILDQILLRMFRLRATYGQIKTAVGFAATSTIAWCFAFQTDDNFKDSMKIWRVAHNDIFKIWSSVTAKFISDPVGWMLTVDAPVINNCLMTLGLHPSLCSVRINQMSRSSSHRIYKVFLPRVCSDISEGRATPVVAFLNQPDFCLKVHDNLTTKNSFSRESEALRAILKKVGQEKFYAFGSISTSPCHHRQEISWIPVD